MAKAVRHYFMSAHHKQKHNSLFATLLKDYSKNNRGAVSPLKTKTVEYFTL